tara:strand:+ start:33 stop:296 length:264 start_codon:yes stop_codon:yes gene_type:complete
MELLTLVIIIAIPLIYFIPSIIARKRKHPNRVAILVLNLFLGWTFLGWVAALVWAFTIPRGYTQDQSVKEKLQKAVNETQNVNGDTA